MVDDFILRAIVAGIGIALVSGVLGCFVIWKRLSYFGDSLSHSTLLGISLGFIYNLNLHISILALSFIFSIALIWLKSKYIIANDALLGILSYGSLSLGIVIISLVDGLVINLHSYLFGDILSVGISDIYVLYGVMLIVLLVVYFKWNCFLIMCIDEDLAKAEKINIFYANLTLVLLLATVVSISIQYIGVLLITSMLIIPAASACIISKSPVRMAIFSSLIGILSVINGVLISLFVDIPTSPTIVLTSFIIFMIFALCNKIICR